VELVLKVLPHVQVTVISLYSGWIEAFMADSVCSRGLVTRWGGERES
jgi:hypothetical protein